MNEKADQDLIQEVQAEPTKSIFADIPMSVFKRFKHRLVMEGRTQRAVLRELMEEYGGRMMGVHANIPEAFFDRFMTRLKLDKISQQEAIEGLVEAYGKGDINIPQ